MFKSILTEYWPIVLTVGAGIGSLVAWIARQISQAIQACDRYPIFWVSPEANPKVGVDVYDATTVRRALALAKRGPVFLHENTALARGVADWHIVSVRSLDGKAILDTNTELILSLLDKEQ